MDESIWRLCIPKGPLQLKLLRMYHQSASTCHPGREKNLLTFEALLLLAKTG